VRIEVITIRSKAEMIFSPITKYRNEREESAIQQEARRAFRRAISVAMQLTQMRGVIRALSVSEQISVGPDIGDRYRRSIIKAPFRSNDDFHAITVRACNNVLASRAG